MSVALGWVCGMVSAGSIWWYFWDRDAARLRREIRAAREDARWWETMAELYGADTKHMRPPNGKEGDR